MGIVEGFERRALFNITRAIALVCITVFLLGVIGASVYAFSAWQEAPVMTKVSAQDIISQLRPTPEPAPDAQAAQDAPPAADPGPDLSPLYGYRIPFALQEYMAGDNAQIIKNHLDDVPAADRQAYLDELGSVVTEVGRAHLDAVSAINAYLKTKAERYADAAAKHAAKWDTLKYAGGGAAAGLFLVALFSLVLVLLAIERNTRPRLADASSR